MILMKKMIKIFRIDITTHKKELYKEFQSYAKGRKWMTHSLNMSLCYKYRIEYHHPQLGHTWEEFVKYSNRIRFISSGDERHVTRMKHWTYGIKEV